MIMTGLINRTEKLMAGRSTTTEVVISLGIFTAALGARIPWLWEVPRYIDELREVKLAYMIYQGQALPLHNAAHDIGSLHNYILAGLFSLTGPNIFIPRLYVAVTSALTVVLIYYLGNLLYGRLAGLLAAVLLLTNGMHILVTHMAWSNCTTPFFFTLALLALVKAENGKNGLWLVASAFLWALTLQTHSSVIIYIAVFVLYVLRPRFKSTGIKARWYLYALLAFLAGYSNMIYFNIISGGGSIRWLVHKSYAMELQPGLSSYLHNLREMFIELIRTAGSIYTSYDSMGQYLSNPWFLITTGLLLAGGVYTCRIGKTLPVWMLIGGFAVMPWINHRYVFYLAARYIMPLLICALLLIACGFWTMANYVAGRVGTRISNRKPVLIMLMIVIAGLQLVPLYNYCSSLADTNQSNQMALQTAAIVEQANRQKNKLVMVDKDLPLENEPLPILFEIMQQPYKVFKISTASDKSIINNNSTAASPGILILSAKTFALKKEELAGNKIIRLTQRVAFPSRAKDRRNIYIIEMKKKSDQAGKNTV